MTDLVTFGETMLRLSTPPGERIETAPALDVHVGGAESNVAAAAAQLGVDAAWLSKLPESSPARRITDFLRQRGVAPRVARGEGRVGTYYLERSGEPRGAQVRYNRQLAPIRSVTPDELDLEVVDGAEVFFTSGITPALSETARATTRTLLERARDADVRTGFDVNYRAKLWTPEEARDGVGDLLPLVDLLVVAERDAATVLGRDGKPEMIAAGLADEYDIETVIVTRGEQGALAYRDGTVHERESVPTETHDPVGSGDAFVGGFLAKRLQGGSVPEALAWGVAAASLTRTVKGDVAVLDRAEVEDVLEGSEDGIAR